MKQIIISLLIVTIYCCKQKDTNEEGADNYIQKKEAYFSNNNKKPPQHITSLQIPDSITFAGEVIPIERSDVREALETELMVNVFRHSRTMAIIKSVERWRPFILQILKEQNIPEDFLYLAVVESEFDNNATSPAGAVGMWQLMEETAKDLKLIINKDVDMRRDPKESTEAAARYLKKAYSGLNSWTLTAAGYNVGVQGIKNRLMHQKVENFFDLHLNSETSRYVYRIIAFKLIIENPSIYGYDIDDTEKYKPYNFKIITVTDDIKSLVDFAKKHNTTYKHLRVLNPWFNNTEDFSLKVKKNEKYEIRIPL